MTVRTGEREHEATSQAAPSPRRWLVLGMLCLAPLLGVYDTTAVVIALPAMRRDLGFTGGSIQWVLNGYTLALGGLLLLGGRLADVFGRRRVFMAGMALFTLASLAAGLAVAPWMLVAARILQGIGAAAMGPASLSLVTTIFTDPSERNRAIGLSAAIAGVGWIAGMVAGGALTELLSWRWVLLAGAPVALAAFVLAPRAIPESRDPDAPRGLDLAGAITATLGVTSLIYALSWLPEGGWTSWTTLAAGAGGVLLLVGFVVIEARSEAPLVPLGVFRVRAAMVADVGMLLTSCAAMGQLYVLTLYFQEALGRSPLEAGLLFLPVAIVGTSVAPVAGALVQRLGGVRPTALLGLALMVAGLFVMSRLPLEDGLVIVLAAAILFEIGLQLANIPLTIAATTSLPERRQGIAAGLLQTTTNFGNAVGLAVAVGVIALFAGESGTLVPGLRAGLVGAIAFAGAGFLLIFLALPRRSGGQ